MTPEEFRVAGHALVDWIADHRARVPDLPVQATTTPGEVAAALPQAAPATPQPFPELLDLLEQVVVPGVTQTQSPHFFGWFPSNASLASVLGDVASSGVAALGITWQSAPALTEVEQVVTAWLRAECGLDPAWRGAIHDTASTATLVALLAARERASSFSESRGGLQGEPSALVVYTTAHAHSSVEKAALLAGYGRENVRIVGSDEAYAMVPEDLRAAISEDLAAGRRPAAVVAAIGTTGTAAVDPVARIVEVAAGQQVWVHVDAAMAGAAMLLPECRELFEGVDGADSLVWNPHKWFGTILDCSLLYVRDPDHLVRVMSTDPSYLRGGGDDVLEYRNWGIPLGRRFRALKLWFHLHLDGLDPIRDRLRRDLANAAWLAEQVDATPGWRVLAPVVLQTVCLRYEPDGLGDGDDGADGDTIDDVTLRWARAVNASGRAFVTPALLDGRWMVRVSIGAEATERDDVAALWELLQEHAAAQIGGPTLR